MRLRDRKRVRVGECKAVPISSHFCRTHQQTPLPRHTSLQSLFGVGAGKQAPVRWLPAWPCPRREGQDAGLLLDRDWADPHPHPLALCPLPFTLLGSRTVFGGPSPIGWGEQGQKPARGPSWVKGLPVGSA